MQYNISPETILGTWKDDMTVNELLNTEFDTSKWKEIMKNYQTVLKEKEGLFELNNWKDNVLQKSLTKKVLSLLKAKH